MAKPNRLALSVLVVFSLAAFAAAQSYTVTDLGPGVANAINGLGDVAIGSGANSFVWSPGGSLLALAPLPGGSLTVASGINRQGLVVGESVTGNEASAVLWTNGEPLDLGTLGGTFSTASGINASGEVSGYSTISSGAYEAFVWSKATGMQGLGFLAGGGVSNAFAINRVGQVAGASSVNGDKDFYAFIWSKTTGMKNLGKLPGYDSSGASAINDLGQVAGISFCGTDCGHAVLWSKGSMLDLGVLPGAKFSYATGINNVGQVVGYAFYSIYDIHAFIWSPSTGMLDLNRLIPANSGWLLQSAAAINDQGQIVGYGMFNGQKQTEAFLLTPQ
jgi:probable HAF family extracellular repeat protein